MTAAIAAPGSYQATVARFRTTPVIDGTLEEGEWDGAMRIPAVMNYQTGALEPYQCEVYLGFTRDHLYIAVVSELPPDGQLVANQTRRGANPQQLVFDDGVEVYIDPNRQNRARGAGERSFFYYHGNSVDAYTTIKFDSSGAPDPSWDGQVEVASKVHPDEQVWVKEMRIPWSAMRVDPEDVIDREIGVLIARNIHRGLRWIQGSWFPWPNHTAFVTTALYPMIHLTEDAPTVSLDTLGGLDLHKGPLQLKARIFNPGPARQARVRLDVESTTMPELADEKVLDLPADGVAEYAYSVSEGRLHEHANHELRLAVTSPDGEQAHLVYEARWNQAPENRWPGVPMGPQPDQAFTVAYYPSYNHLRLTFAPRWLELEDCRSATYRLQTSRGATLLDDEVSWSDETGQVDLTLPELLDDTYTLSVEFPGWDDPVEKTFVRKRYPWEGNRIGITEKVLPPFEPIRVEQDGTVQVVLRAMQVNGLGLWNSIQASGNVSAGGPRELLAAPMQLVADGNQPLAGEGRFTKTADYEVIYEGRAEHPAVVVETRMTTEIDGCTKFELTL